MELKPIILPERYNYVGVFLTLRCTLGCSYCINRYDALDSREHQLDAGEWMHGLNRLTTGADLPITLQGGEPTLHPDFYAIVNGLRPDLPLDLLTNLQFDVDEFMARISPDRFKREAPYASIRVSFHPERMEIGALKKKVLKLLGNNYSVGIWGVDHPAFSDQVRVAQKECQAAGIDFRIKEFLGEHDGRFYGTYSYSGSLSKKDNAPVQCRTTELLVGPGGNLYRCHSDLYDSRQPYGSILDPDLAVMDIFRPCTFYGFCNPCDVKTKTNRFQEFGHTSVDIRFPEKGESMEAGSVRS